MSTRRILVTNAKGGCGKTTTATHLAAALAHGGLRVALADCDRQKSSLRWLKTRNGHSPEIQGLDWTKAEAPPKRADRLVIDCPGALPFKRIEALISSSDVVVVPILPSIFDEDSTRRLLKRVSDLKPIRKGKKDVAIVANRLRPRTRATARLEAFLARLDYPVAAQVRDRAAYADLALEGLTGFDVPGRRTEAIRTEWLPLIHLIEGIAEPARS
ncbi:MAG: division plane positioning ATPase MipZ [Geminicoccaceae bacterium]